jgi:hypothetical protein
VTAVDDDPDMVESARRLGVDAHVCRWPAWRGGPYDAVLFTRSLHHMHDLDAAVAAAGAALAPAGRILVEDFAFAEADAATTRWLAERLRAFVAMDFLRPPSGSFAARLCAAADPLAEWRADHEEVQPLPAMRRALAAHASIMRDERTSRRSGRSSEWASLRGPAICPRRSTQFEGAGRVDESDARPCRR